MSVYKKSSFSIPSQLIYLDGNSLGPLANASHTRIEQVVREQWGKDLISSWNKHDWFHLPEVVGNKIARILNAPKDSITVSDSTSINLYKLINAAITINDTKRKSQTTILSDDLNFPTDLYITQGIIDGLSSNYSLEIASTKYENDPTQIIIDSIKDTTAIVMLTHVGYDSGYAYDMKRITEKAHSHDALVVWDLSHSIGTLAIDIDNLNVDFAVGCTYKYLNGGPGSPAFMFVNPKYLDVRPTITGWMGQDNPFDFNLRYNSASNIRKFRVGTPHIISLASLDAALSLFDDIDMKQLETEAQNLLDRFIIEVEQKCPSMRIINPRDRKSRGTQLVIEPVDKEVSAYAIIQNLIAVDVVGDFRRPNSCRFGIAPLYVSETDIEKAVHVLAEILNTESWNNPNYLTKALVT